MKCIYLLTVTIITCLCNPLTYKPRDIKLPRYPSDHIVGNYMQNGIKSLLNRLETYRSTRSTDAFEKKYNVHYTTTVTPIPLYAKESYDECKRIIRVNLNTCIKETVRADDLMNAVHWWTPYNDMRLIRRLEESQHIDHFFDIPEFLRYCMEWAHEAQKKCKKSRRTSHTNVKGGVFNAHKHKKNNVLTVYEIHPKFIEKGGNNVPFWYISNRDVSSHFSNFSGSHKDDGKSRPYTDITETDVSSQDSNFSGSHKMGGQNLPYWYISDRDVFSHDSNFSGSQKKVGKNIPYWYISDRDVSSHDSNFSGSHKEDGKSRPYTDISDTDVSSHDSNFSGSHKKDGNNLPYWYISDRDVSSHDSNFSCSHKKDVKNLPHGYISDRDVSSHDSNFSGSHKEDGKNIPNWYISDRDVSSHDSNFSGSHKMDGKNLPHWYISDRDVSSHDSNFFGSHKKDGKSRPYTDISDTDVSSHDSNFSGSHKMVGQSRPHGHISDIDSSHDWNFSGSHKKEVICLYTAGYLLDVCIKGMPDTKILQQIKSNWTTTNIDLTMKMILTTKLNDFEVLHTELKNCLVQSTYDFNQCTLLEGLD